MPTRAVLAELGRTYGAVMGVGPADPAGLRLHPELAAAGLAHAVVFAVPLLRAVLATNSDHPSRLYFHHYRQVNLLLDRLALAAAQVITRERGAAVPVAASQIIDWAAQRGHLSHKHAAIGAGLGWLGRCNLLVHPEHGAGVRLVTVLTDLPLTHDQPRTEDCGACRACLAVCPARAVRERAADFDHQACFAALKGFVKTGWVGQYVCGICVRACADARVASARGS